MKFMNLKRFASTVMAGVLTLSLVVPVFAADTQPENSTIVNGTYSEIPVSVEVPTTGTAQLNPYGLPIAVTKSTDTTVDLVGQKITTMPLSIKNQGTSALDVGATLAVVPKGDVSIAATAGADTKAIKVDLEVAGLSDATLAIASTSTKLDDLLIDKFAAADTWTSAKTLAAPNAAKGAVAADVTPAASPDDDPLATLGAATVKGEIITYAQDSIALFRLSGDLSKAPKDSGADDPWVAADGFTATIVFKFVPAVARYTVTKGTLTGNDDGGDIAIDKTKAEAGETVTITVTPDSTNSNVAVTVKDAENNAVIVTPGASNKYTFTMPASNVTVTAAFTA